jgi:hypothetical protein
MNMICHGDQQIDGFITAEWREKTVKSRSCFQVTIYTQNYPNFIRWRLQPEYNSKGQYLSILQKCPSHKYFIISGLWGYEKFYIVFNEPR